MIYFLYRKNGVTILEEKVKKDMKEEKDFFALEESEIRKIIPTLPINPGPEVIKENLSRLPAQIEYLEELEVVKKSEVQEMKTLLKAKNKALDITKSKIRQEYMKRWKEEMKNYIPNIKKLFEDFENDPNMNKIMMQQLIKDLKPEKPTKNDLDDFANLKTEDVQKELYQLEKMLNALEAEYEAIRVKINKYENTYISVRAHVRMLEKQYDRN